MTDSELGDGVKKVVEDVLARGGAPIPFDAIMIEIECYLIDTALKITSENKNQASGLLGMGRTTLVEKCRKFFPGRIWKQIPPVAPFTRES